MGYVRLSRTTNTASLHLVGGHIDHQEILMTELDHGPWPTPIGHHAPVLLERASVFARLGRWTATRLRLVLLSWLPILVGFGFLSPPVAARPPGGGRAGR